MNKIALTCPNCSKQIIHIQNIYKCNVCNKDYAIKDGIICLLSKNDQFYEGAYDATTNITFQDNYSFKSSLFFDIYRDPYQHALKKYIDKSKTILDIGCGGGIKWISQKNQVIGIDLSFASLKKTTSFYNMSIRANCLKLPFPAETFDIVISSSLFEHLEIDKKKILLNEIYRVIKPNGFIILIFDCDSHNPLIKLLKKDSILYKECFVNHDHHYGLNTTASFNLDLIANAKFSILEYRGLNKTILQYFSVYQWMEPYGKKSRFLYFINALSKRLVKIKIIRASYYCFLNWFDIAIEKLLPLNYSRLLVVVAQR
jgi:ubiquinone/menaquinone biosynthesis C-methylase UbiE